MSVVLSKKESDLDKPIKLNFERIKSNQEKQDIVYFSQEDLGKI